MKTSERTLKTIKATMVLAFIMIVVMGLGSLINSTNYYSEVISNGFLDRLKQKFNLFNEQIPEDRVYLQFDKPFYYPGENIWFAAYVRNGMDMKPSLKSDILHVEFIGPRGNVEKQYRIVLKNGKGAGDFSLDAEAAGGLYKVKAYTEWQKNEKDTVFFEKNLQVQDIILPNLKMKLDFERKAFGKGDAVIAKLELSTNENKPLSDYKFRFVANLAGKKYTENFAFTDNDGIKYIKFDLPKDLNTSDGLLNVLIDYQGQTESVSRSIPIVLNNIKFALFPEGGDMVSGLDTRVAFKATNEFGKPADVEGIVCDSKGNKVAEFSSFHFGMGAFDLTPAEGEAYTAKITKPEGVTETFTLPEALSRGYVLTTDNSAKGQVTLNVNTTETEELSLVAQVRGKIYYSNALKAISGNNKLIMPTDNFPMGVAQVTLFDSKGIERAERVVFVNKDKQLNISVTTDKEKYLPREKVKMTVSIKDERGLPMPGVFSLAVTNDQLLSFADDKSGNILSKLMLEPDVKGTIEEPFFYFKKDEPKADKALDYLLMTSGWRRYTWEQVLENDLPALSYQGEKAVVSGTVVDYYSGKPVAKAKVGINGKNAFIETGEKGEFSLANLDLSEMKSLKVDAAGFGTQYYTVNDYNRDMKIYIYNNQYYGYKYDRLEDGAVAEYEVEEMKAVGDAMALPVAAAEGIREKNIPNKVANAKAGKGREAVRGQVAFNKGAKPQDPRAMAHDDDPAPMKDKKKVANENAAMGKVGDLRADQMNRRGILDMELNQDQAQKQVVALYYRAKEFSAPVYDKQQTVEVRNDFRSTVYWNGNIEIDRTGKKSIEFYNSDDISSFRATVEGVSSDGTVGRIEKNYFTQLPFAMACKVPTEVVSEDLVSVPLTLKNNTDCPLHGMLNIITPHGFQLTSPVATEQNIAPFSVKTIYLTYKVTNSIGIDTMTVAFESDGLSDAFTQKIKIVAKGFPVNASFSGQDAESEYTINLANVVAGSVKAQLTAYPSVVSDLMKGVESILGEPYGCFEQTSMTSYPNVLVMEYLKATDEEDSKVMAYAENLLDKGYKKLVSYETKEKGYEWFGSTPAHEALTAYGLMQFNEMKGVYKDVDQKMIDRTAAWIMSRKDGKGGFKRNGQALDNFGGASEDITNAYIVYSLSEAGFKDIQKEADRAYERAMDTKDPYQLGLVANALYNLNDAQRATKAMNDLLGKQAKDGSWTGATHSITRSTGKSLTIETTSLAILALLKSAAIDRNVLGKAVEYLVSSRSGYGSFGSTQGTIMALKALTEYAKNSKKTDENGTIEFYVDGQNVAKIDYKAGQNDPIALAGLEKYIGEGKHELKVKYVGAKNPLPYSLGVTWNTFLPNSDDQCNVSLSCKLSARTVKVGETVRLSVNLENDKKEGLPSTIAIIGLPAGLSAQPWQLKELQEKKVFDYYEIIGNNLVLYYRQMAPSEVKEINFDLKAEIPGEYDAPASSAYLYYTNEFKCWCATDRVTVKI